MPRDITVTFDDGTTHLYKGAPDTITPEIVQKRAEAQFGKAVTGIDGGRQRAVPSSPTPEKKGTLTKIREGVESIVEPAVTMATGLVAMPIAGAAGLAGDIYAGVTGGPRIGEEVASDVMSAMTYAPRSEGARENLQTVGKALEVSKLAGLPVVGQEIPALAQGIRTGTKAAAPLVESAVQRGGVAVQGKAVDLMINALKGTPTQLLKGDVEVAANELLKRGLRANREGVIAIEARIAELNNEIANKIGSSQALINKQKVVDRLTAVRDRFANTVSPEADLATVARVGKEFIEHPLAPGETIPIKTAQAIKQGTYAELKKKYGQLGSADVESQKALARGIKEEIAKAEPSIVPLNAEESRLFRTLDVIERRALMDLNKDPLPLYNAWRNPAIWAAYTADKSSAFKALTSKVMYKLGEKLKGPGIPKAPRMIEINKDIPYSGLPYVESPPIVPGIWREPWQPVPQKSPLPVMAEDLLPLAEKYAGTQIPIGMIEGGVIPQKTPLPQLPPMYRGMLSLADEQPKPRPVVSEPIDFKLRQEVLQQPEIVKATQSFIQEAERLKTLIKESSGFWKARYRDELNALENEFALGMRQLGIDNPQEAIGLQKLYQSGQGSKLRIEKTERK